MAQPTEYERSKNFTEDPISELDTPAINAELDKVGNSVNETITCLKKIMRDDRHLMNKIVDSTCLADDLIDDIKGDVVAVIGKETIAEWVEENAEALNLDERIEAQIKELESSAAIINDNLASTAYVYSSKKVMDILDGKTNDDGEVLYSGYLSKSGGTISGDIEFSDDSTEISSTEMSLTSTGATSINGSSVDVTGNTVTISDGTKSLVTSNGTLSYSGNASVIGALSAGSISTTGTLTVGNFNSNKITSTVNGSTYEDTSSSTIKGVVINAGGSGTSGATLNLKTIGASQNAGSFVLKANSNSETGTLVGNPDGSLLWNAVSIILPVGVVLPYAGGTVPKGWLLCDGKTYKKSDYQALHTAIGTAYGVGKDSSGKAITDGSSFQVPDLINKFIQGKASPVANISAGLPKIASSSIYVGSEGTGNPDGGSDSTSVGAAKSYPRKTKTLSYTDSIYGKSTTVQPPAVGLLYIIKAK